jgi:arabinogalactan oligomer/maltooligosaccharide transport system permease protein
MSNPTHTQVLTTAGSEPRKIRQPRMSFGKWARQLGWKHAVGLVVCLYAIFPILYITSTALSKGGTVTSGVLFSEFYFGNFTALFDPANQHDRPFTQWVINTIAIASINAFCSVFISALAAYAFSRMRFAGRRGGLMTLILVQMFPSILGLVAIYGILSEVTKYFPPLGLGSLGGLIMIYLGGSLGGGTYLMYGFFNTVPKELDEAAKIDGATHTQIYFGIILRLVAPVLAVQALLSFIGTASDYILPSIVFNKPEQYTLAVGLQFFIDQPYSQNWAMFCAGALITATPVVALFLFLQRFITSGLTGGAVKG